MTPAKPCKVCPSSYNVLKAPKLYNCKNLLYCREKINEVRLSAEFFFFKKWSLCGDRLTLSLTLYCVYCHLDSAARLLLAGLSTQRQNHGDFLMHFLPLRMNHVVNLDSNASFDSPVSNRMIIIVFCWMLRVHTQVHCNTNKHQGSQMMWSCNILLPCLFMMTCTSSVLLNHP